TDTLNFNWFNVSGTTVYLYLNLYLSYKGDRSAVRTASVSTDKTAYSYGEVISLAVSIKDHNGQGVPDLPIYVRILQGIGTNTTVIKDLGNVARTDANGISTFTIAVNAENFPSAGQYTIEVADNANYSAAAILTQQIDVNAIMMLMMISVMLISAVFNMISSFKSSFSPSPSPRSRSR
ncbi:MAG: hypothetical protein QW319_04725, partial [Candidatus Nitrosocaldus sp.]